MIYMCVNYIIHSVLIVIMCDHFASDPFCSSVSLLGQELIHSFGEQDQGLEDDGFNDLHNSGSGSNGQRNKVSFFTVFCLSWHQMFFLL